MVNDPHIDNRYIPSQCTVYKQKSKRKRVDVMQDVEAGASRQILAEFIQGLDPDANNAASIMIAHEWVMITDDVTIIPYSCEYLIKELADFLGKGRVLRLVVDFTHDVCRKKYKLGCLSAVAMHYSQGQWRNTVLPIAFCIAHRECSAAYLPLAQAAKHFCTTICQLDLFEETIAVFTDGHPSARIMCELEFPGKAQFLCLGVVLFRMRLPNPHDFLYSFFLLANGAKT